MDIRLVAIPFSEFGKVHQYATIPAGSTGRVFYLKIPNSCVGFIYKVGNNYYDDTYLTWIIDGATVEDRIERMIGDVSDPERYDPPWLVENYIEWTATNNSSEDIEFEVLVDGYAYMRRGRL